MSHARRNPAAAPADGGRGRGAAGPDAVPEGGGADDGRAKAAPAKGTGRKDAPAENAAAKAAPAKDAGRKAAAPEADSAPKAAPQKAAPKDATRQDARQETTRNEAPAEAPARRGGDRAEGQPTRPGKGAAPVPPTVAAARPRRRHGFVTALFLLVVALPLAVSAWYLYARAADQYASTVGFSVRREEAPSASELLGNLPTLSGASSSDTDVLNEFMQSQEVVERIDARLDLREMFSKPQGDPVFALGPDSTIEDLVRYWNRMVAIYYDGGVGLIELRVLAFEPGDAQAIAQAIFDESSAMINDLTAIAREDATRYARAELEAAVDRLKEARTALTEFRSRTRIVDPNADIQGQMGLLSTLQGQLAESLIELDLLRETTRESDPRIRQAEQRIAVIEKRIEEERAKFGIGGAGESEAYATLVGEYESLIVDREFAEQAYLTALTNYDAAQAEAQRQSRYLAAHIKPTLAQSADYPRRGVILGAMALFAFAAWGTLSLVYYSIRDRR